MNIVTNFISLRSAAMAFGLILASGPVHAKGCIQLKDVIKEGKFTGGQLTAWRNSMAGMIGRAVHAIPEDRKARGCQVVIRPTSGLFGETFKVTVGELGRTGMFKDEIELATFSHHMDECGIVEGNTLRFDLFSGGPGSNQDTWLVYTYNGKSYSLSSAGNAYSGSFESALTPNYTRVECSGITSFEALEAPSSNPNEA